MRNNCQNYKKKLKTQRCKKKETDMDYTFMLFLWMVLLTLIIIILWIKTEKITHYIYGQFQLQKAINASHAVGLRQLIKDLKESQEQVVKLNLEVNQLKSTPPGYDTLDPIYVNNLVGNILNTGEAENWDSDIDTSEEEILDSQIDEVEQLQELSHQRTKL